MSSAIQLNETNFESTIASNKAVVIDFWAPWCGPCKMLSPILDQLASELSGNVLVAKVNVDEEQGLAQRFNIASIPTLVYFKNGKMVDMTMGLTTKEVIKSKIL